MPSPAQPLPTFSCLSPWFPALASGFLLWQQETVVSEAMVAVLALHCAALGLETPCASPKLHSAQLWVRSLQPPLTAHAPALWHCTFLVPNLVTARSRPEIAPLFQLPPFPKVFLRLLTALIPHLSYPFLTPPAPVHPPPQPPLPFSCLSRWVSGHWDHRRPRGMLENTNLGLESRLGA